MIAQQLPKNSRTEKFGTSTKRRSYARCLGQLDWTTITWSQRTCFNTGKGGKQKCCFTNAAAGLENKQSTKPWWESKIDYYNCESRQEMLPSNDLYEMIIHKAAGRTNPRQRKTATCGETATDESSSLPDVRKHVHSET